MDPRDQIDQLVARTAPHLQENRRQSLESILAQTNGRQRINDLYQREIGQAAPATPQPTTAQPVPLRPARGAGLPPSAVQNLTPGVTLPEAPIGPSGIRPRLQPAPTPEGTPTPSPVGGFLGGLGGAIGGLFSGGGAPPVAPEPPGVEEELPPTGPSGPAQPLPSLPRNMDEAQTYVDGLLKGNMISGGEAASLLNAYNTIFKAQAIGGGAGTQWRAGERELLERGVSVEEQRLAQQGEKNRLEDERAREQERRTLEQELAKLEAELYRADTANMVQLGPGQTSFSVGGRPLQSVRPMPPPPSLEGLRGLRG